MIRTTMGSPGLISPRPRKSTLTSLLTPGSCIANPPNDVHRAHRGFVVRNNNANCEFSLNCRIILVNLPTLASSSGASTSSRHAEGRRFDQVDGKEQRGSGQVRSPRSAASVTSAFCPWVGNHVNSRLRKVFGIFQAPVALVIFGK